MKKQITKRIICTALLFAVILSAVACAGPSTQDQAQQDQAQQDAKESPKTAPVNFSVVNVSAKDLIQPSYGEEDASSQSAAKGANDFAFRLSSALLKDKNSQNFVCSPFSVWMPLAALVNATDEKYKQELLEALSVAGISEQELNEAASRILYDLTKEGNKRDAAEYDNPEFYQDPLKIANALFVGNDVTVKKEFAQIFMDYYRGSVVNVDFKSQEAVDKVNQWASDNTEGLIEDIIKEFDPNTVAAIANAIYFSDRWAWEFDPAETAEGVFNSPNGETTAEYMLREGDDQVYYEDDTLQAIPLRFKTGGGMYILLPKDGDANALLSSMTGERFESIIQNSTRSSGKLLLPKFSIESGVMQLKDALVSLGVPLFDRDLAALTGGVIEEDLEVFASGALHKALIEVDEKGTTAAAVTVITMETTSMPIPTEPFNMVCDKPFVFVLYGDTYDGKSQVLFTGVVNEP